jgi:hypothetical protein
MMPGRLSATLAALVAFACRRAGILAAAALIAAVVAGAYVAGHFSVHTELAALIPPDTPWRAQERALEAAFVSQGEDITVVIDGATPELAEASAARLADALAERRDLFRRVDRPGADPYFATERVLFLSVPQVRDTTEALIRAQPLLAPVAADPSLRGVLTALSTGAEGVATGLGSPQQIAAPLQAVADTADRALRGRPAYFSWRPLITGDPVTAADRRQFVIAYPKVGADGSAPDTALASVQAEGRRLGLDAAHGVRLRLTGAVPMESDELATLGEATGPIALFAFSLALAIIYLAVRSPRIVAAIVVTVLVGLTLTAALGLAVYGRFNLISVAFLPLFVGLGVDFAIQFSVRYCAEAIDEPDIAAALTKAGAGAAGGLSLAVAATALGFFAFLPTRYKGVSELGFIAGSGMLISFLLVFTLLPALLTLARARSPAAEAGLARLRNADAPLLARRHVVLVGAVVLALAGLAASPFLRFDFDPLRLRNPHSESVATFLQLANDPQTGPDSLDILTPDLAQARAIAARLSVTAGVRAVMTADSLIPPDQAPKLALIQDAALILDPTINPFDVAATPSDAELVESLGAAVTALRALADAPSGASVRTPALRLAGLLETAQHGPAAARARLQSTLVAGLSTGLDQVRGVLGAQPATLESLPAELRADWLAADGRARVQVLPSAAHADKAGVARFAAAVQGIAPGATGNPVAVPQTRALILGAFGQAGALSLVTIALLLAVNFRRVRPVILTLAPVLLSGLLTVGTCVLLGQDINLENLIALPLLIGIGVSFNIYFVVAWESGERALLASSLARAVIYSALTTAAAFGALGLSQHPGTASMGVLLLISLFWTLVVTLIVQPALLRSATRGA